MSTTAGELLVDSGVLWKPKIPSHWETLPLFAVCRERQSRNTGCIETNVLSLSYGRIVRRNVESNYGLLPESFETYNRVETGDVVLRLTDLQNDVVSLRVGLVKASGIITFAYQTVRPSGDKLTSEFLYYLLHSYDVHKVFYGIGGGVRQAARFGDLKRLPLIIPPVGEQKCITDFLDRKTAAIDALIAKKERLIELLQEKRQALITQALTKGLDPSVPMKESGVPWLGLAPARWDVQRLRYRIRKIEQGWSPSCENRPAEPGEWGVLKVGCVNYGRFNALENKALPSDLAAIPEFEVGRGDVLVSRANTRELVGSAAFVEDTPSRLLLCDKLFRIRYIAPTTDPRFLVLLLQTSICRTQIEREATGASGSMQNIGQDTLRRLVFAWPPLDEQHRIVDSVGRATARLAVITGRLLEQLARLREYRQALITAAVTGQIDVSEVSAA